MTLTLDRRASAPRRAWRQDPPARCPPGGVYPTGGKGGRRRGSATPLGSPHALTCGGDDAAAIVVAAVARPLLPANAANAGAADVLGRRYSPSPPLAVAPLLLRQLLLLLRLSASASASAVVVIVIVTAVTLLLAVIVAASAAVAAPVGGGRTRMIA